MSDDSKGSIMNAMSINIDKCNILSAPNVQIVVNCKYNSKSVRQMG